MSENQTTGRTAWDFATEAFRSRTVVVLVCIVFIIVPLFVHFQAEPGSEISLFVGLIKYKKATLVPPTEKPDGPVSHQLKELVLPKEYTLKHLQTVAILDYTLNVTEMTKYFRLGGVNIETVKLAARSHDGRLLKMYTDDAGKFVKIEDELHSSNSYVELEYKSQYFALNISRGESPSHLKILRLSTPTMRLRGYSEL